MFIRYMTKVFDEKQANCALSTSFTASINFDGV